MIQGTLVQIHSLLILSTFDRYNIISNMLMFITRIYDNVIWSFVWQTDMLDRIIRDDFMPAFTRSAFRIWTTRIMGSFLET